MSDRLIEIWPGSTEWDAWLKHHRGSKAATRMLACLGGKTKRGDTVPMRPWLARSKMPPDAPRPERVTRSFREVPGSSLPQEHFSAADGAADAASVRLLAVTDRRAKEAAVEKRRRKDQARADEAFEKAQTRVLAGRKPQVDGGNDLGALDVADPEETNHPVRTKIVNLRDDPVGRMAKRGHLGRGAERDVRLNAARHWQRLYEQAEIGGARAIDPTKDIVDGRRFETPDTTQRLGCQKKLGELNKVLGKEGGNLVLRVLGEKFEIRQVAATTGMLGVSKKMDEKVLDRLGWRFRDCLDSLAQELGYATEVKRGRPHNDAHASIAKYADNPDLHRAVHRARAGH